jgi:hypothetical protein
MRFEVFDYAQHADGSFAPGHSVTIYEYDGITKAVLYVSETGGTTSNPIVSDSTGLVHCWVTSTRLYKSVDGGANTPLKIIPPVGGLHLSATDYGAKFDGTGGGANAINDAVNEAYNAGGGVVLLPPGVGNMTVPMVLKRKVAVFGASRDATTISNTTGGPVVKVQDDCALDVTNPGLCDMTLTGKRDDPTSHGILMDTHAQTTMGGINHGFFKRLHIYSLGGDGIHITHNSINRWAQWLTFEDLWIGSWWEDYSHGCQGYAFYAEGGFSTNLMRNLDCVYNDKGVYIGTGTTTYAPQANTFERLIVTAPGNGNVVAHGVELGGQQSVLFDNPYIEWVGQGDTSHSSYGIYVNHDYCKGVTIRGGIFYACHTGIYLNKGVGANISGVVFGWDGSHPAAMTDIAVTNDYVNRSAELGINTQAGTAHTYLSDPNSRLVGFRNVNSGDERWDGTVHATTFSVQGGPQIVLYAGNPEGHVTAQPGSICLNTTNGASQSIYVKKSYYGNLGWVAVTPGVLITSGTAVPTSGTWAQGDQRLNTGAAPSGYVGWVCTTAGTAHPACTGDTTDTSTSITNVNPTTAFANGDAIRGAGIPSGTTVVSGGGTATLVISQAATATATGVSLYDAVFKTFGAISA